MKARISDKLALEAVSPAALRAYVQYEGWQRVEPFGQYSEVYARADAQKSELIIPVTTQIADYASAVSEAVRFIAKFEDRDELALYADLIRADRDVVRVRAPDADDDGSIAIDNGVEVVHHARDMLASAACAALEPRRAYHLGKVQQAEEYMRRVRLGQTERGSFVVNLLAPMPPALTGPKQTQLWPDLEAEPYERQVTRVLMSSLHAAHDAIVQTNRGEGLDAFVSAVPSGVSANLCEAIAAIIDQGDGADVSVTWARTRPAPVARDRIVFGKDEADVLREAARQFRLKEPRRDERIIGYVTHLHRPEDQVEGKVTIKAIVDGRARSLAVQLAHGDYDVAVIAHGKQVPVTIVGDLETEGQRWQLKDPRNIQIMDYEDAAS